MTGSEILLVCVLAVQMTLFLWLLHRQSTMISEHLDRYVDLASKYNQVCESYREIVEKLLEDDEVIDVGGEAKIAPEYQNEAVLTGRFYPDGSVEKE